MPVNQSSPDPSTFIIERNIESLGPSAENALDVNDDLFQNVSSGQELWQKSSELLNGNKLLSDLEKVFARISELPQRPPETLHGPTGSQSEVPKDLTPIDHLSYSDFDTFFLGSDGC